MTLLKQAKAATNTGYKASCLSALSQVIVVAGSSFDDSLNKDIWKAVKSGSVDRSAKIAAASFTIMDALAFHRSNLKSSADYDHFRNSILKAFDSQYAIVRQAAARCLASVLFQITQFSEDVEDADTATPSAKSKKARDLEDDDDSGTTAEKKSSSSKPKPLFSQKFSDTLKFLSSTYTNINSSPRVCIAVIQSFGLLILRANPRIIRAKYFEISCCLYYDILAHANIKSSRYKYILAKKHSILLLNDTIAIQILGEYGQLAAVKVICNELLKKYPKVLHEEIEPSKEVLVGSLDTLSGLIKCLGSAIDTHLDLIKGCLMQLLSHPSFSVQTSTNACLKAFVIAAPSQIIPLLTIALNQINREIPLVTKRPERNSGSRSRSNSSSGPGQGASKILGFSQAISVLVSISNSKSEYSSLDLTSRVLTTAISLLKSSGSTDAATSAIKNQVAWQLISGLMPVGPNFVKVHLSQLLLLWKGALPKPLGKDQFLGRSSYELCYLLHIRHCALGALVAFIAANSKLITLDVAKRISALLHNTVLFLSSIRVLKDPEDDLTLNSLSVEDYDHMVRRRVLQGYLYLLQNNHSSDLVPASLLTSALGVTSDPEKSNVSQLSTTIAASSGTINSIWETCDNFAYGLTSKLRGFDITEPKVDRKAVNPKMARVSEKIKESQEKHWLSEANWLDKLESQIKQPILESLDQDPDALYHDNEESNSLVSTLPAATAVVDLSIELFAVLLPHQPAKVQESMLVQLLSFLIASKGLKSSAGRKSAVVINSILAVHGTLKYALTEMTVAGTGSTGPNRDVFKSPSVLKAFFSIIKEILVDPDPHARHVAAQSMGLVCSFAGSSSTAEQIKLLIDEIVANRDPNVRAGSALCLGYILKYVGGMFVGLHLKTVLGILVSLATDPHPTVHFWALEAISVTIESSGLIFSNYASSTLSTLGKLYLLESHSDEGSSAASTNLDVDYSTTRIIARCVDAIVNSLGPDLRENSKTRLAILNLIQQFEISDDYMTLIVATRSIQELIIFIPEFINLKVFLNRISSDIMLTEQTPLRTSAVDALYQLFRTRVTEIFQAKPELQIDIWLAYDNTPWDSQLQQSIQSWLQQSDQETIRWIRRIQAVLLMSKSEFTAQMPSSSRLTHSHHGEVQEITASADDEVAGFAAASSDQNNEFEEPLRWQTRVLAVDLLRQLIEKSLNGQPIEKVASNPLVKKVGDLIKIAFSASTGSVVELRLLGVRLLNDIITDLRGLKDPEFEDTALLEQFQAQIGSALTPAFSADSSPELASQAVNVCATFIGSGIVRDVERMGRLLKILIHALESCTGKEVTLGELRTLSPNAQIMLKMAILSSWADLQVSSVQQEYLHDVVQPYAHILVPLWLSALREYAQLRFEPEQSSSASMLGAGSIDQMYSALSKASILQIYQQCWLQLIDAIASMIDRDSRLVFEILGDERSDEKDPDHEHLNYSEPAAFFFVMFGICFESLVSPQQSALDGKRLQVLIALQRILQPSVCGNAIYKDAIFAETIDLLDRLMLTGTVQERLAVVIIARNLCINHFGVTDNDGESLSNPDDHLSENVDQLFELVRVVMLGLTSLFPFLIDGDPSLNLKINVNDLDNIRLARSCLISLVDMVNVFPTIIRVDLYSCLLYVISRLLENDECQGPILRFSLISIENLLKNMIKTWETSPDNQEIIEGAITTSLTQVVQLLGTSDRTKIGLLRRCNALLCTSIIISTCSKAVSSFEFVNNLSMALVENFAVPEVCNVAAETTNRILVDSINTPLGGLLLERTIPSLVSLASGSYFEEENDKSEKSEKNDNNKISIIPKLVNDILVSVTMKLADNDAKGTQALGITLPMLTWYVATGSATAPSLSTRREYVKLKLIQLAQIDAVSFKAVLQSGLSQTQRQVLEQVLRGDQPIEEDENQPDTHIELKSF